MGVEDALSMAQPECQACVRARSRGELPLCGLRVVSRDCHDVGLEFGEGQVRCVAPCSRNSRNSSRSVPPEMNASWSPQLAGLPASSFPREVCRIAMERDGRVCGFVLQDRWSGESQLVRD